MYTTITVSNKPTRGRVDAHRAHHNDVGSAQKHSQLD